MISDSSGVPRFCNSGLTHRYAWRYGRQADAAAGAARRWRSTSEIRAETAATFGAVQRLRLAQVCTAADTYVDAEEVVLMIVSELTTLQQQAVTAVDDWCNLTTSRAIRDGDDKYIDRNGPPAVVRWQCERLHQWWRMRAPLYQADALHSSLHGNAPAELRPYKSPIDIVRGVNATNAKPSGAQPAAWRLQEAPRGSLIHDDTFSISALHLSIKVSYFSNSGHKNEKVTSYPLPTPRNGCCTDSGCKFFGAAVRVVVVAKAWSADPIVQLVQDSGVRRMKRHELHSMQWLGGSGPAWRRRLLLEPGASAALGSEPVCGKLWVSPTRTDYGGFWSRSQQPPARRELGANGLGLEAVARLANDVHSIEPFVLRDERDGYAREDDSPGDLPSIEGASMPAWNLAHVEREAKQVVTAEPQPESVQYV
eukprot:SAG31_NODE_1265_length_9070_cov_5.167205_4_plen_423_part_00